MKNCLNVQYVLSAPVRLAVPFLILVVTAAGYTDPIFAQANLKEADPSEHAAKSGEDVIHVRLAYDPLQTADALPAGAHPVGGPATIFVDLANRHSNLSGVRLAVDDEYGADNHPNLHEAVALGAGKGGFDAGIGLAIANGHDFGELLVAGLPFACRQMSS
ncbi:MAG: hypothetical protein PF483_16185 [Halothiobacillus sp.]|jgi:hypothetical protein|nr:hypothetical protein [Halothiobacillus sp.]